MRYFLIFIVLFSCFGEVVFPLDVSADTETESIYSYVKTLSDNDSTGALSLYGGVSVPYHFYKETSDKTYSASTNLGDATNDDEMVIVRYDGNLTINTGVTLTTLARKRGLVIYVKGNLTDNGTISMTGKGARTTGQNVLIMRNINSYSGVYIGNCGNGGDGYGGGSKGSGTSYAGGGGGGGSYTSSPWYTPTFYIGENASTYSQGLGANPGYPAKPGNGAGSTQTASAGTLIIMVEGNITFSGATLSSVGENGYSYTHAGTYAYYAGGGGGGGGGSVQYFYAGTRTGSPTVNVTGGIGGGSTGFDGSNWYSCPSGENGATGSNLSMSFAVVSNSIYSYVQIISDNNTTDNMTLDGGVVVPYHFYKETSDKTYSASTNLGDATNDDEMVIVRYDGNLTINTGVTLTTLARKRGLVIYVKGNLTDNGTISMTARGAKDVAGQYLTVIKINQISYAVLIDEAGCGGAAGYAGSAGTSYSGGAGGGGAPNCTGTTCGCTVGTAGTVNGGAGGDGGRGSYTYICLGTYGCGYEYYDGGSGGAGNPGGGVDAGCGSPGTVGSDGTGGLLILIVDGTLTFGGSSVLSSAGSNGGATGGAAGGSGGGVIKYFYGSKTGSPTTNVMGGTANGCSGTVTNAQMVNMSNVDDSYNFGAITLSENYTTGLDFFTVTNNIGDSINIAVFGGDLIGSGCTTMTLSDTAVADNNTYGMMAGLEGEDYNIIVRKTYPFNELKHDLNSYSSQKWGLKLIAPTAYTGACAGGLSGNVTLSATVH